ncbi:MAG: hypothetical protein KGJ06_01240 [Pseudomonadota bacterium]|nr:hypothetical protein [Pseudomonadota bacterium]
MQKIRRINARFTDSDTGLGIIIAVTGGPDTEIPEDLFDARHMNLGIKLPADGTDKEALIAKLKVYNPAFMQEKESMVRENGIYWTPLYDNMFSGSYNEQAINEKFDLLALAGIALSETTRKRIHEIAHEGKNMSGDIPLYS